MANETLVATIKKIATQARAGQVDEAHMGYRELFASQAFMTYRPEEQRQALKLMILVKRPESKLTPTIVDAHRAALGPLTDLVSRYGEAADHEMLGICHVLMGNLESAATIFKAGLQIERAKNAGSDLCGSLMTRLSAI
jgi:hypothetical protein